MIKELRKINSGWEPKRLSLDIWQYSLVHNNEHWVLQSTVRTLQTDECLPDEKVIIWHLFIDGKLAEGFIQGCSDEHSIEQIIDIVNNNGGNNV